MGFMTLGEFRQELNHTLGTNAQGDNSLLDIWINRAYFEVANVGNQEHLKICVGTLTIQDAAKYQLPDDLMEILSTADLTSKRRLMRTSIDDYHLMDRDTKGAPRFYVRQASSILFWPTPDREYQVEMIYIEQPARLTDVGDRSAIPNVFDHAITLFAARNGLLSLGRDEEATLRHQSAVAYLREQQDEMEHSMGSIKQGVRVAQSFDDVTRMRSHMGS